MSDVREQARHDFYRDPDCDLSPPKDYSLDDKINYIDELMNCLKEEDQTRVGEP